YKLFDVKVIATGLFGFILVGFAFAEIILAKGLNYIFFRSVIFLATAFFVFLLVKSVLKDIKQKEQLEKLADDLKQSNIELEERNLYLTSLQKISNLITRSLDFEKVTQSIVDAIANQMGYVGGILSFIDETKQGIYIGAISNTPTTAKVVNLLPQDPKSYLVSLQDKENVSIKAIQSKEIQFSSSFYDSVRPALTKEVADKIQQMAGVQGVMFVPVYAEDEIVGVLDYILAKPIEQVSLEEKEMMKSLADQVGIVSRNLQLFRKLEKTNTELREANFYLQKLDKAKSEFLSIASHQLRTPLTGIKGYLSMILEGDFGKVEPEIKKVILEVYESSDRLTRLVNVFLNVSRIESGRFQIDKIKFQLADLVTQVVKELNSAALRKKLVLSLKKSKGNIPEVMADKDKIKDVLLNLIDNSIKYTPSGQIDVSLEKTEDNKIKVMVKDTGVGIDPEEAGKLFAKFSRGDGIAQIDTTGSGLGLYIAKKIVETHGGKIWAESDGKGKGSRFIFELPIE
ncbi:MAG: GAF domain-containing sensor histidine kinase, partial [Candidatus Komeilibacteria bacterium]|nr:GAF domain-containing sensor histidine kinase [Candidatus Komeilibacteria bacterium]